MYKQENMLKIFKLCNSELSSARQSIFSDTYFYANVCHVCLRHDREAPLKRCINCKMIFYCNKIHQTEDWPSHRDFCKAITSLVDSLQLTGIFQDLSHMDEKMRLEWKSEIINSVEKNLKRKLLPYEKQMIEYPKVCMICYEDDIDKLRSCSHCPHANFCVSHFGDLMHNRVCNLFTLSCTLDAYTTLLQDQLFLSNIGILPYRQREYTEFPNGIFEYANLVNRVLPQDSGFDLAIYISDFASYPLTFLYALKKLSIPACAELSVHVIGASIETEFSEVWELVFHLLPPLSSLRLTFIGPECEKSFYSPNLCELCIFQGKKLCIESFDSVYKNYCQSNDFKKPDLVLGFNIKLEEKPTWKESLWMVKQLNCPFVLTSSSDSVAREDHKQMQEIFGYDARLLFWENNPYTSLRPSRNSGHEEPIFSNASVTLYQNLAKKKAQDNLTESRKTQDAVFKEMLKKNQNLQRELAIIKNKTDNLKIHYQVHFTQLLKEIKSIQKMMSVISHTVEENYLWISEQ